MEQGRAVLWSELRGYRHPLDKLRSIDKELFDQFETLSGQLERLAIMSVESRLSASESSQAGSSFEAKMQHHRIFSEKWDDVVDKIRQVPDFTVFLRAVPFATLQKAAAEVRLPSSILAIIVLTPLSFMLAILSLFPYLNPYQQFLPSCLLSLRQPAFHKARILQD